MRVLGVAIANGYSPEVRAAAGLFAHRRGRYDALMLQHAWRGDRATAARFQSESRTRVAPLDLGWRPTPVAGRSLISKLASYGRFATMLPRAGTIAARYGPDVLYSSAQRWDCRLATYLSWRTRRPQIVHLHYPVGWWLGREVLWRLQSCDHVIAVSDFIRQNAIRGGVPADRVTLIRYAIPLPTPRPPGERGEVRRELGIPGDAPVIGMVARLDRSKGQIETIQAFAKIAPASPEAHLVIAGGQLQSGTGLAPETLGDLARSLGVAERVHVLGARSDVPRLLGAFDVFAHPSLQDASPFAVIEASAHQLPVVAWHDGGVAEIVADEQTGLLADVGDVAGLGARLQRLLDDPGRARALGVAGRERVGRLFDPEASGAAFASLVARVAAKHRSAARSRADVSGQQQESSAP